MATANVNEKSGDRSLSITALDYIERQSQLYVKL